MLSHTFTDIVTGLFIFATLMNALLCLVFKGRKQTICINSLLITATATAISLSVMWLQPAERSRIKVTKDQPVTFKADSLQSYLIFADVIQWVSEEFSGSKFVPPANECNRGRRQILGYAEDKLKGMLPSYPDNEDLVIRFCLVSAEIGNDPCEQIKHYTSPKNRDETLGIFTRIFCREETSSAESKKFQTAIEKTLPLGWYRRSALMTVYALLDDKPSYQRLLHERKDIAKCRLFGMLAAYAYFLVVLLVGFIVVCRFLWQFARGRGAADKLESHLSIRTVYGIWLMTLYCRVIAGLSANCLAQQFRIHCTPLLFNWSVYLIAEVAALLNVMLAVYFLLVRPGVMNSLKDLFAIQPAEGAGGKTALIAFYGFCASLTCATLASIVLAVCRIYQESEGSVAVNMLAMAIYPEPAAIAAGIVVVVLVGPILEELLCRALLYRWLRKHLSPLTAALISGLVFAAMHRDPSQFVQFTFIGIVLAIVFERSKSLWAAIVAHSLYNLSSTLWMFAFV